jgi:nucleoside-diphosphate-sugar epimerase/uncharacterized membrane protein
MARQSRKPLVLITGAAGDIGSSLIRALHDHYTPIGLDLESKADGKSIFAVDLTSDQSVQDALARLREQHGRQLAAVVHLAAYFDFTGEEHPLYRTVNVEGTSRLLRALRGFEVGNFIYASTMLVHAPAKPDARIDERTPIEPGWAYPKSKAAAEAVIEREHGAMPYTLLRFAGLYDDRSCVPTLAHQIARIYERDLQSHLYPADPGAGQSFIHRDDLIAALRSAIDRRDRLPPNQAILVGEPIAPSFEQLQNLIGQLVHGEREWTTLRIPAVAARAGAWLQQKSEPLVPDAIDQGKPPFIRPFMVERAGDHYELDISRARELLDWTPRHDIRDSLPRIVAALKDDPIAWYRDHGITLPAWMESAAQVTPDPDQLRSIHERRQREILARNAWAHWSNAGLATWLMTAPFLLGYESRELVVSDVASGCALLVFSLLSLSWRAGWARWVCATIGLWLLSAPVLFWAPTAMSYLNDTLVGMLVIGFAVATRPVPGLSPAASTSGPTVPPGWDVSPSSWAQRLPIIALAFVGLHISRYLAAYQLGHIDGVWEPFFPGGPDPKNGTEEVITSSVSRAWPVPDAGLGAVTYALEIVTGLIGSARRWRTMPWLVVLFGLMIVPLGVVSLTFIIIQPIWIGTWCTLCLIAAVAMLIQIPYSLDELVATGQFLMRRKRAGRSLLAVFFMGDTDEPAGPVPRSLHDVPAQRPVRELVRDSIAGGVGTPWNLLACTAIGAWLMFSRLALGNEGAAANADHLLGALVITISVIALSEVGRAVRLLNVPLGIALVLAPILLDAPDAAAVSSVGCGVLVILLSLRRGPVRQHYARWDRLIV